MTSTPSSSKKNKDVKLEKALVKIIVIGNSSVGKTSLIERYAKGRFSGERRPTIGTDFMSKRLVLHDIEVNLQIWDTAGQERFHQGNLTAQFYRGAHGAMIVYDVNNEESFEIVKQWRDELIEHTDNDNSIYFPVIVIGNKVDIREGYPPDIRIDQTDLVKWCQDHSYGHIETSAKDGSGVEAAMLGIVGLALELQKEEQNRREIEVITQKNTINNLGMIDHKKPVAKKEKIVISKLYEPKNDSFCPTC